MLSPPINPAGQATFAVDMSQLHRMDPEEAAQIATFSVQNTDNSTTTYRASALTPNPLTAEHS